MSLDVESVRQTFGVVFLFTYFVYGFNRFPLFSLCTRLFLIMGRLAPKQLGSLARELPHHFDARSCTSTRGQVPLFVEPEVTPASRQRWSFGCKS